MLDGWFGIRATSKWAAVVLWISSLAIATPAWASNPWGRAVGEANCLHDVTEDLSHRAHRLFPSSPTTMLTCALDESACRLVELVKCSADWGLLQAGLHEFEHLQTHLCQAVANDCHMSRDRAIANYLRMVDDRFGDLVRDLSKCKVPLPNCPSPYPSHYHSSVPLPYSSNYFGAYPSIPPPIQPQPVGRPVSTEILSLLLSRAMR